MHACIAHKLSTAHREDLEIISMGARYFSSYDACDNCHTKLYNQNVPMRGLLTQYATRKGYSFFKDGADFNAEDSIPFSTFFYASRPYTTGAAAYQVEYTDLAGVSHIVPVTLQIRPAPPYWDFPAVPYRYHRDSLPAVLQDNSVVKLKRGTTNIDVADTAAVWSYVEKLKERAPGTAFQ